MTSNIPVTLVSEELTFIPQGGLSLIPIYLKEGDLVSKIKMCSGPQPAVTPTHCYFALFGPKVDGMIPLLGKSKDQGTLSWPASSVQELPLLNPVRIKQTGLHYIGISMTATTRPTLLGSSIQENPLVASLMAGPVTESYPPDSPPDYVVPHEENPWAPYVEVN
jgi:hypothetical protein